MFASSHGDGVSAAALVRSLFPRFSFFLFRRLLPIGLLLLLPAAAIVWLFGSRNPYTPAGYVGYLTKGAVFGKSRFHGVQKGPTSAGRAWATRRSLPTRSSKSPTRTSSASRCAPTRVTRSSGETA